MIVGWRMLFAREECLARYTEWPVLNTVMQLWRAPSKDLWPKEWLGIDWKWGIQSRWVSHTVSRVENKLLVSCLESFLSLPVALQHTCASQHLCMLHAAPFSQGQESSACENCSCLSKNTFITHLVWQVHSF